MFLCCFLAPDVDECKEKLVCQCPECKCKNTWGSYECSCGSGLLYLQEHDLCISKYPQSALFCFLEEINLVAEFHLMFTIRKMGSLIGIYEITRFASSYQF